MNRTGRLLAERCPPRTARRSLAVASLLALGALATGCGASPAGARATEPAAPSDALASVRVLIGDAACDQDDQCRTVAVGSKACGGPEAYLAWSTRRTDTKALDAAAAAYGTARTGRAMPGGRVSDCMFVSDPGAMCLPSPGGRSCQLRARGSLPTR